MDVRALSRQGFTYAEIGRLVGAARVAACAFAYIEPPRTYVICTGTPRPVLDPP